MAISSLTTDVLTKTVVAALNGSPGVANPITDQVVVANDPWSFQLPADVFSGVDRSSVSYSATLDDGSDLPDWISLEETSGTFSATLPSNFAGALAIKVTAHDGSSTASDIFNLVVASASEPPIVGTVAADWLEGTATNDVIVGLDDDDRLDGGAGDDIMVGGAGNDNYFIDSANDVVAEAFGEGYADSVYASVSHQLGENLEILLLLGTDDLSAQGNELSNIIAGNDGNNLIDGDGGIDGLLGGSGNDTYIIDSSFDEIVENVDQGFEIAYASVSYALSANIENLILQGSGDFQGIGNAIANTIVGNGGNNYFDGRGGADYLVGGDGDDYYVVDNSFDQIVENVNEGVDTVCASASYALSANVENLLLQGSGDFQGIGNDLANIIFGNSGSNYLDGGAGVDHMAGGAGNDVYMVDSSLDQIVEIANDGNDAVYASVSYQLGANLEMLFMSGSASQGYGNASDNRIVGTSGDNGVDGGGGADVLTGNGGLDTFIFNVGEADGDTVMDFDGADAGSGDQLMFVGFGPGASLQQINGNVWQINYNGGTSHEQFTLTNGANVHASDFVFV